MGPLAVAGGPEPVGERISEQLASAGLTDRRVLVALGVEFDEAEEFLELLPMMAELEEAGVLTPTSLHLPDDTTWEEFVAVTRMLGIFHRIAAKLAAKVEPPC